MILEVPSAVPMCNFVSQDVSVVYLDRIKWRKLLSPAPLLSASLRGVTSHRTVLLTLFLNIPTVKEKPIKAEVQFTLLQATKAQKGSRGIALLFL